MTYGAEEQTNSRLPNYARLVREDAHPDLRPSFMHLGHWDEPDERPLRYGMYEAQRVLANLAIDMSGSADGSTILDVGCGFGGLCQLVDDRFSSVHVIGFDIDATQLDVCASLVPRTGNRFSWLYADAMAIPVGGQTVDSVIAVESAMHFRSRKAFFGEIARILRPSGRVAIVDILIDIEAAEQRGLSFEHISHSLAPDFAPWPELDAQLDDVLNWAIDSGLQPLEVANASDYTLPSYSLDAYIDDFPPGMRNVRSQDSIQLFIELHRTGVLNIYYLTLMR